MALPKLYDRITWHNNTTPALNEDNLNAMSKGLDDVDDRLISLAGTIMETVPQIQEDMAILGPAVENIDANVARAEGAADDAEDEALKSEGYALGTQDGVEVTSGEYYQNNAKYYAEIANPPIENTVDFTDIITISDAINKAAKDVRLKVEAVQDLHGYDKPWVGGAGKNILPMTVDGIKALNTSGTWSGNAYTYNGVTFTIQTDADNNVIGIKVNGTASQTIPFSIAIYSLASGTYTMSGCPNGGETDRYYMDWRSDSKSQMIDRGNGNTYTSSGQGGETVRIIINQNYAIQNLTFYPQIELGSSKTSFEPYTNICPISGWDNAKVTRGGKNLCESKITGNIGSGGGIWNDTSYALGIAKVKKGQTYVYMSDDTSTYVYAFYTDVPVLNSISYNGTRTVTTSGVFTAPIDGYIAFRMSPSYAYAQCEVGTQATSYEPYQGIELTISLGGTRYGGTLDVTSGVLTVDRVYGSGTVTGINDSYANITYGTFDKAADSAAKGNYNKFDIISSMFYSPTAAPSNWNDAANVGDIFMTASTNLYWVGFPKGTTQATMEAATADHKIVYELATPQTIQLTPTQVYLLYGYNTLFGDCGDISLTYDASGIIHIEEAKLDTETLKTIAAASSDFADFKARIAAL